MFRRLLFLSIVASLGAICFAQGSPAPFQSGISPSSQMMTPPSDRGFHQAGSISGTVLNVSGDPVKSVQVQLQDASNGSVLTSVYTNDAGQYVFSGVRQGSYEVMAFSGVRQTSDRVEVGAWPVTANLRMPVSGKPDIGAGQNTISVMQYRIPDKAREEFTKAQDDLSRNKVEDGEKHLDRALAICPNYANALTLRGIMELSASKTNNAMADLQKAIQSDGNYALAYTVMGAALNSMKKFDEAIRSLQRGASLEPDSWQTYFEMAKAYLGKADFASAIRQLDRAEALTPNFPTIRYVRGFALMGLKQYQRAATELQAFLEKVQTGPESDQARQLLSEAKQLGTKQ
jgi:tetratricopeptide (TPR) repeat protein